MNTIEDTIKIAVREAVHEAMAELPKAEPPDNKRVMSVKDAAEVAHVGTATIYEWIARADCDFAYPVGRNKKILRHKFLAWLERQAGGGVKE